MLILVINCGSSSIKFAVVETNTGDMAVTGLAERLGTPLASAEVKQDGKKMQLPLQGHQHQDAMNAIAAHLESTGWKRKIQAVGHRIVHGGSRFMESCLITEEVTAGIEAVVPLSPLHNPAHLIGIRASAQAFQGLPMVAVFDTAFHQTMPEVNWRYPVPHEWYAAHGVRKYGAHGTNHRHVAKQANLALGGGDLGLITLHLGNGCSASAVQGLQCVDTSMGLTPLDGMMMGTRSGGLDPAIVAYMTKQTNQTAEQIVALLNQKSGLLGVSGSSNDMRTLLEKSDAGDERARLAVEMFCNRAAKTAASLAVNLTRWDAIVFTGGIGENAAPVREKICQNLAVLGVQIDPEANQANGKNSQGRISKADSAVKILIVPAAEELAIALDTAALAK